ncbi:N-acetylmuramoyl-L-alanine amidase [Mameliella sediminis]|uniref:N-acetylmuramoyl-L-alanine amidase n=1 Tax=Mameliella sediminis TaxID=2836866 RepID=UPI001C43EB0F|nr:N-acetylmuramoyl-L-alanine amidase [Mameliella sediminis]MBV7394543.1 N-acetylmuramoyl-L-alanine amidase [Mameliella sediminis]
MIYQGKARYPVHEAVLHTSATAANWDLRLSDQEILDAFWRWHVVQKGWRKIGYHRIIRTDGRLLWDTSLLRSLSEIGAHVKERNRGTIGICLIPLREVPSVLRHRARFEDYYTEAQRVALQDYLAELGELTPLKWVTGHNDYTDHKSCPGWRVDQRDWLAA